MFKVSPNMHGLMHGDFCRTCGNFLALRQGMGYKTKTNDLVSNNIGHSIILD